MDSFSSSVSTFTLPTLISSSREVSYLKNPTLINSNTLLSVHHQISSSSTFKPSSILCKTTSNYTHKHTHSSVITTTSQTSNLKHSSSPSTVHEKAASGYATALIEIARVNNFLEAIEKDVRKLSRLLNNSLVKSILNDPLMEEKVKGEMVNDLVAGKGRFHKHLVVLCKMLVDKNKVGIVNQVLNEFQRIYDELNGTQVVLVPSGMKMKKEELFGIAKRVQKLSGASKVKVKHIVDAKLPFPSFAT